MLNANAVVAVKRDWSWNLDPYNADGEMVDFLGFHIKSIDVEGAK